MKKILVLSLMMAGFATAASAQVTAESCRAAAENGCEGWTDECTTLKHQIRSGAVEGEQIDAANACSQ